MVTYKVRLRSTGAITQLPDSQKIFGALITKLAERNIDKVSKMVKSLREGEFHFALSNVMPSDYFPMPHDYIVNILAANVADGENLKKLRSNIKKRVYVTKEGLEEALNSPKDCEKIYPYIKQSDVQQLRSSIDSVFYDIQGLETKLYTVPAIKLVKVLDANKSVPVTDFCFYLQGDDTELMASVRKLLDDLKNEEESLKLGMRASQGLNKYKVVKIKYEKMPKDEESFLNLGMLLPNEIDYCRSTLKLFTSERRPYGTQAIWNNDSKYFISFINVGSIIALPDGDVKKAGKSILSPNNENRDVIFGNAFLYPIKL